MSHSRNKKTWTIKPKAKHSFISPYQKWNIIDILHYSYIKCDQISSNYVTHSTQQFREPISRTVQNGQLNCRWAAWFSGNSWSKELLSWPFSTASRTWSTPGSGARAGARGAMDHDFPKGQPYFVVNLNTQQYPQNPTNTKSGKKSLVSVEWGQKKKGLETFGALRGWN